MVKLTTEGLKTTAGVLLVDISGTANFTRKVLVAGMQTDDDLGDHPYHLTFVKEGVGGVYEQYVNRQLTYNPKTNTLTTGTISATSSASTVDVTSSSDEVVYPVFIDNLTMGSSQLCAKPGSLSYNQTSNTLNANLYGTSENAKKVFCENKNGINGDFYVNFINGSSSNYYSHFQDQDLKYNPSTGTLTATKFSGEMTGTVTGTASSATNADNASKTTIVNNTSLSGYYPVLVNDIGSQAHTRNTGFKFDGSSNLIVDILGTATIAEKTKITELNATGYPILVTNSSTGDQSHGINTNLRFTSGKLVVDISGTATIASKTDIGSATSSTATIYPVLVSGAGSQAHNYDSGLSYVSSTKTLSVENLTGTASKTSIGTAASSTTAIYPILVSGTGSQAHNNHSGLSYVSSTKTLSVENLTGTASRTSIGTAASSTTAIYPILVSGTGSQAHNYHSGLSYVSSTNTLTSGKFNASGADFAEYMKKKNGTFVINGGDICGIDQNGLLTNVFAESFHFCVKSTSPAIIAKGNKEQDELTEAIAFCGQVPVNVFQCSVGDYIVPTETTSGLITGKNISSSSISFDQYKLSVGKVIRINADGTAEIIVKI